MERKVASPQGLVDSRCPAALRPSVLLRLAAGPCIRGSHWLLSASFPSVPWSTSLWGISGAKQLTPRLHHRACWPPCPDVCSNGPDVILRVFCSRGERVDQQVTLCCRWASLNQLKRKRLMSSRQREFCLQKGQTLPFPVPTPWLRGRLRLTAYTIP